MMSYRRLPQRHNDNRRNTLGIKYELRGRLPHMRQIQPSSSQLHEIAALWISGKRIALLTVWLANSASTAGTTRVPGSERGRSL